MEQKIEALKEMAAGDIETARAMMINTGLFKKFIYLSL
jgi:hypothetical protein